MLRKLELEALRADLLAVNNLLASRTEESDPFGWIQYTNRKKAIEKKIEELEALHEESASVALYFNGSPVVGTKGIRADFAGKAIDTYQDIITKRLASVQFGQLGSRGPVRHHGSPKLMITEIVRGSFGFVLEELTDHGDLFDTPLKEIVSQVTELFDNITAQREDDFDQAMQVVDSRTLIPLKRFFQLLDDNGSTLRVADNVSNKSYDASAIQRGRSRIERVEVIENEGEIVVGALIGLMPIARKFEMKLLDREAIIAGSISPDFSRMHLENSIHAAADLAGKTWRVRMKVREVREQNKPLKTYYTLHELIEEIIE